MSKTKVVFFTKNPHLYKDYQKKRKEVDFDPSVAATTVGASLGFIYRPVHYPVPITLLLGIIIDRFFNSKKNQNNRSQILELIDCIKDVDCDFIINHLSEASTEYTFEPGHLVEHNSFYISDPIFSNCLLPIGQYQERIYQEKMLILKRLVGTLGAKSFQITNLTINQLDLEAGVELPVAQIAGSVGVQADFNNKKELTKGEERVFGLPEHQPFVPPELGTWIKFSPDLRGLVDSRLESNAISDFVSIKLDETTTAGCKIAIKASGLNIGTNLKVSRLASSTWTFKLEYYSKQELSHLPKHISQR